MYILKPNLTKKYKPNSIKLNHMVQGTKEIHFEHHIQNYLVNEVKECRVV